MLGGWELWAIIGTIVLLFGGKKIPEIANSVGKSIGAFKKGRAEAERELKELEEDKTPEINQSEEKKS